VAAAALAHTYSVSFTARMGTSIGGRDRSPGLWRAQAHRCAAARCASDFGQIMIVGVWRSRSVGREIHRWRWVIAGGRRSGAATSCFGLVWTHFAGDVLWRSGLHERDSTGPSHIVDHAGSDPNHALPGYLMIYGAMGIRGWNCSARACTSMVISRCSSMPLGLPPAADRSGISTCSEHRAHRTGS